MYTIAERREVGGVELERVKGIEPSLLEMWWIVVCNTAFP